MSRNLQAKLDWPGLCSSSNNWYWDFLFRPHVGPSLGQYYNCNPGQGSITNQCPHLLPAASIVAYLRYKSYTQKHSNRYLAIKIAPLSGHYFLIPLFTKTKKNTVCLKRDDLQGSHTCKPNQNPLSMHFLMPAMLLKQNSPQKYQEPSNPAKMKGQQNCKTQMLK